MTNRGLGRGFDSLIPTNLVEEEFDPTSDKSQIIKHIKVELIDPNPHQPRTDFDTKEISALAASIQAHGILQPLVATPKDDRYQLIAGERRLRAAKETGLKSVPVIVRTFDEQQSLELALIENLQRQNLNPVETATAYQKLIDQFNLKTSEVAAKVGRDESTIKNIIRLLKLPHEAKLALAGGRISEGHARAILSVRDPKQQEVLLKQIEENDWSVRRAEEFARDVKSSRKAPEQITSETPATRELGKRLATKVQLQRRAKGGRLLIHYQDDNDLERIINRIKN